MNRHIARALIQDALYQVLDNSVFRIMVVVAIVLIAPTILISFGETEVSVLFGWKTFAYSDLTILQQAGAVSSKDAHVAAIQALQSMVVEGMAGTFGIMLSLAATAFFVPRMLEKGEADILFSKPVGRTLLLVSRYLSGILFVGVLSFVLVLGMHLGFLVRSGYSDTGFLWGSLTLVYVFALVHAVSTVVGVFTRSAVTALLVSILFFGFNGCVHGCVWVKVEHAKARVAEARAANDGSELDKQADSLEEPLTKAILGLIDAVHYVLPKTNDADVITRKLRTALTGDGFALRDDASLLVVERDPKDFTRSNDETQVDTAARPFVWTVVQDGRERARLTVSRRTRLIDRPAGASDKPARQSTSNAASELLRAIEARKDPLAAPERLRGSELSGPRDGVRWREEGRVHERAFLGAGDWMHEVELVADDAWRDDHPDAFQGFLRTVRIQRDTAIELSPEAWYERRFGWTSIWKYNAFFSLGTSIAFALILLWLASWRLKRIDF